jgi:hypothetical protein
MTSITLLYVSCIGFKENLKYECTCLYCYAMHKVSNFCTPLIRRNVL